MPTERPAHEEISLESIAIYQAPQAKAMQFYVPLPVFAIECIAALVLLKIIGFWIFTILAPVHVLMVIKTAINPWWVEDVACNFKYRFAVRNKGINGKEVITFSPHTNRREIQQELKNLLRAIP